MSNGAVIIFGVRIDSLTLSELLNSIHQAAVSDEKKIISNVNIHGLNLAYSNSWFRSFLNRSDIVFCDGFGVILGSKLLGTPLKDRITYADWTWDLAELTEQEGFSIFLLGGKPGVAEKAAKALQEKHPKLMITGTRDGYFDKGADSEENKAVIAQINQCQPNILIVGFGMPLQEKWIQENFDRLDVNVFLPVGAALDYVSGEVRRGPRWMTDHGLEWLGRLIIEPRRLWKRYLFGIPVFFWQILLQRLGLLRLDEDSSSHSS